MLFMQGRLGTERRVGGLGIVEEMRMIVMVIEHLLGRLISGHGRVKD